ncbi:S9 family peptidase [Luteimonas sp. SJ-92]|uniref:S9 family peptidase n=2 Tax=Luteimonas salinisoli TaxID=2752307 RepID=A0A853J9A3_9GAMM|nr:prolyl oligopeptidase family serine peptidase [Luteimonas salinisoli]NZA25268.1 S9 family peptidase [Luteimonas salinisoli]
MAVLGLLFCALLPVAAAAQVDVEPYVAEERFRDIKLSPTGEYYAASVPLGDQTGLVVIRRSDGQMTANFRFRRGTHVGDFWWVNPERVLISVAESFGTRDDPLPTGELYGINADGGQRELLVGWRVQTHQAGTRITSAKREERVAAYLVDRLADDDRSVLIAVRPLTRDAVTRVERMNVYTGHRTRVAVVPLLSADFVTDSRGRVRFAVGTGTDNISRTYYRSDDDAEWWLVNDERTSGRLERPLGFSDDDATAYLRVSRPKGPDAIVAMQVGTGERSEILRDATVDPVPVYRDGGGALIGVRYSGARPRLAFFDEQSADARLYRSLEAAFPDTRVEIQSATADGRHKLVLTRSDVDPGSFYVFDSTEKKADFILARRAQVDPRQMAPMRGIALKARDGTELHGFLTIPTGGAGTGLPLVVMPHGGPYGVFDEWDFDEDTQLLASAGYAVLRVNYRGSGNYGRSFRQSGARQWGGTMQDDLTDATRWAIGEGIADPERVCIYGASYGGYAALMGAAKEPDLYRCAIGYVGVYDLPKVRSDLNRVGRSASTWSEDWLGNDSALLAAASPNRLAERIKVPVLLAAGGEDLVAPIEHSTMMERALVGSGAPVETLYFANEGHGFYTEEHRREFYVRLLGFLSTHIGGAGPVRD